MYEHQQRKRVGYRRQFVCLGMGSIEGSNERVGSEGSGVRLEGGILLEQTRVCALGICRSDQPQAILWGVKPSKGHAPLNAMSKSHTYPG